MKFATLGHLSDAEMATLMLCIRASALWFCQTGPQIFGFCAMSVLEARRSPIGTRYVALARLVRQAVPSEIEPVEKLNGLESFRQRGSLRRYCPQ